MSEEDKQAATETTEGQAMPATEAAGAPEKDDVPLEELLKEYQDADTSTGQTGTDDKADKIAEQAAARAYTAFQAKVDEAQLIKDIKGNLPVSDAHVLGFIEAKLREEPKLAQAWVNRARDSALFKKVVKRLAGEFAAPFNNQPDRNATESREAVAHAVRGASGKASEGKPPDFSGMTDAEYRDAVKKQYGFNPI